MRLTLMVLMWAATASATPNWRAASASEIDAAFTPILAEAGSGNPMSEKLRIALQKLVPKKGIRHAEISHRNEPSTSFNRWARGKQLQQIVGMITDTVGYGTCTDGMCESSGGHFAGNVAFRVGPNGLKIVGFFGSGAPLGRYAWLEAEAVRRNWLSAINKEFPLGPPANKAYTSALELPRLETEPASELVVSKSDKLNSAGEDHLKSGRRAQAVAAFAQAMVTDPSNHLARYNLARVWSLMGQLKQSRRLLAAFDKEHCAACIDQLALANADPNFAAQRGNDDFDIMVMSTVDKKTARQVALKANAVLALTEDAYLHNIIDLRSTVKIHFGTPQRIPGYELFDHLSPKNLSPMAEPSCDAKCCTAQSPSLQQPAILSICTRVLPSGRRVIDSIRIENTHGIAN